MAIDVPVAINEGVEDVEIIVELILCVRMKIAEAEIVLGIDEIIESGRADK